MAIFSSEGNEGLNPFAEPFNFGPGLESNRSVSQLVDEALRYWPGHWLDMSDVAAPHEAGRLHLQIDKAYHQLGWEPRWLFGETANSRLVREVINNPNRQKCA